MAFGDNLILSELVARPGQSKYLLASNMRVSPTELDIQLASLAKDGMIVRSTTDGDSEPVFWATQKVAEIP